MNEKNNLSQLTTKELQSILKSIGKPIWYNVKTDLITRLQEAIIEKEKEETEKDSQKGESLDRLPSKIEDKEQEEEYQAEESETPEEKENKPKESLHNSTKMSDDEAPASNNFNLRDVEDSLEKFSGQSGKDLREWLDDFENICTLCKWNTVQKFLYCKKYFVEPQSWR